MIDFEHARDKVLMGPKREEVLQEKEKEKTAYHESGHTILAWTLPGAHRVHKVTIIPRGRSLGSTQTMPNEDRLSMSEPELRDHLAVLLGGRAAEKLVYDEATIVLTRVDGHAARLGLGGGRTYDYVLAVDEVASNSVLHGGGAGRLRVWRNGDCLTSEIHDQGLMPRSPETDAHPSTVAGHGRGLWLVHQLCDLVQIRSAEDEGTTIRLHISRS